MPSTLRSLFIATTLAAALAPAVHAGGMSATLEGPEKDATYIVRTYSCTGPGSMRPSGWAEGVVRGERRTLPLALRPARDAGTYVFQRTWPNDGLWMVRLTFARANAPALVAGIGPDGRVGENKFIWNDDGRHECATRLAAAKQ